MGKTVKSRAIASAASFLLVVAFCLVANGSVPKLYESYKQKEVAQQAATQATQVIKKKTPSKQTEDISAPAEEPAEEPAEDVSSSEDANVYDIPEEPTVDEEPVEEDAEEAEDFDIDTDTDAGNEATKSEKSSLLDKVLNFFKSLFEKISSFKLLTALKDFFVKFLGIFGIKL